MTTSKRLLAAQPRFLRGSLARVLAGLWLVLHVVVVAGAPVADGLVDHADKVVVHVEDADGGPCSSAHGPEACGLCQLAHGFRGVAALAKGLDVPGVASQAGQPTNRLTAPAAFEFLDGHSSRAPPVLG